MEECLEQDLGSVIRRLREQANIDKSRFCLMCGMSRPYLNKIEDGKANVTIRMLTRIARSLGVSVSELLHMAEEQGRGGATA